MFCAESWRHAWTSNVATLRNCIATCYVSCWLQNEEDEDIRCKLKFVLSGGRSHTGDRARWRTRRICWKPWRMCLPKKLPKGEIVVTFELADFLVQSQRRLSAKKRRFSGKSSCLSTMSQRWHETFSAEKLGKFRKLTQIAYFVKDFDARVDLSEDQVRQPPAKLKTRQQDQRRQRLGLSRLAKAASLCFPIRYWRPIRVKRLL